MTDPKSHEDRRRPPALGVDEFRAAMAQVPTPVTVVTAHQEDVRVGVTIGSFGSISLDPMLVGFYLMKGSSSLETMVGAGRFCVNVLSEHQQDLSAVMASADSDRFKGLDFGPAPFTGAPLFKGVVAFFDCELERVVEVGDHDLVVGLVLAASAGLRESHSAEAMPLLYHDHSYKGLAGRS